MIPNPFLSTLTPAKLQSTIRTFMGINITEDGDVKLLYDLIKQLEKKYCR